MTDTPIVYIVQRIPGDSRHIRYQIGIFETIEEAQKVAHRCTRYSDGVPWTGKIQERKLDKLYYEITEPKYVENLENLRFFFLFEKGKSPEDMREFDELFKRYS